MGAPSNLSLCLHVVHVKGFLCGLSRRAKTMDDWHEETDDPLYADERNFYKVEQWHVGGEKHIRLLYAGNNLRTRA
jgi:hypothetical protein